MPSPRPLLTEKGDEGVASTITAQHSISFVRCSNVFATHEEKGGCLDLLFDIVFSAFAIHALSFYERDMSYNVIFEVAG